MKVILDYISTLYIRTLRTYKNVKNGVCMQNAALRIIYTRV
nr:MAG TPA: ATP synthase complex subunit h [Caudoviricetes sp.]